MTVADDNIVRFEHGMDKSMDLDRGNGARLGYASHRTPDQQREHDARGLIVAILLCVCCWAALGFFLLA